MVRIRAEIKLYTGINKRKSPFKSGYRPLFQFIDNMKTSGQINLLNQDNFAPGEVGVVEITFIAKEYLGENFKVGKSFKFYEGKESLGEGEILDILD